ncbi:sulfite exporter TauE/SafE family protein [Roseomonas rosulenta]|uniref:sulfite exporter TauE/SafE family protein n=1 Tax=Roseomonas rosulenta TaxID=2748667 RepID=UPI0018DFFC07|nr:sulfite exporter TauE/SafE family protein [Roseomonas rosulenta]
MTSALADLGVISILVLATVGLLIGTLGGLLGIGGGVIAVPVLLEVFALGGMSDADHAALAIGTAQAAILLSSLAAAAAHAAAGTIDQPVLRSWLPAILAGTLLGLGLAPLIPASLSVGAFAAVAVLLGTQMMAGARGVLASGLPAPPLGWLPPAAIGALSAALGIGAGTLSGPVLGLFSTPINRAVGAGAIFNIAVALPATLGFAALGYGKPGLPPDSVGYVSLSAAILLALPAIVVAPFAARLSSRLPVPLLRRVFAACLFAIALRVLWRATFGQ